MAVTTRYILVIILIYLCACDITSGKNPDKERKKQRKAFLKKYKDIRKTLEKQYKEQLNLRKNYFPKDPSYNIFRESPALDDKLQNTQFTRDDKQELKERLVNPEFQVVYTGNSVSISCASSGDNTWTKGGKKLSPEYLSPSNDLFIANAFEIHNGIYTCAGLTANNETFEEDAVVLVGDELYSSIEPQSYEGSVGKFVEFSCSEGKNVHWFHENFKNHAVRSFLDSETADEYWFHTDYDNHPVSRPISSGPSFTIENMQSHDRGSYFCFGQYLNKPRHFLSQATLQVYDQGRVDPLNKVAGVGEHVEFFCQSKKVEWYRKGSKVIISTEDKLIFPSLVMRDKGTYVCKGQYDDSDETFFAYIRLTVVHKVQWANTADSEKGQQPLFRTSKEMSDRHSDARTTLENFIKLKLKDAGSEDTLANDAKSAEKTLGESLSFEGTKTLGRLGKMKSDIHEDERVRLPFMGTQTLGRPKKMMSNSPGHMSEGLQKFLSSKLEEFSGSDDVQENNAEDTHTSDAENEPTEEIDYKEEELEKSSEPEYEFKPIGSPDKEQHSASVHVQYKYGLCIFYALPFLTY